MYNSNEVEISALTSEKLRQQRFLSPQNSRWVKFAKMLKVIVFLLIFFIFENIISFFLEPASSYTRLALHDMYTASQNYDMIFLGSSHAYRSFNPQIFDEKLNINSFNAASSGQSIKGSYFYLKEILRKHKPKEVIMEITYVSFNEYAWTSNKLDELILFDFFHPSTNKVNYFFSEFSTSDIGNVFFKSYRYRENLTIDKMSSIASAKLNQLNYWKYVPVNLEDEKYQKKGFVFSNQEVSAKNLAIPYYGWSQDNLYPEAFTFLNKIVDLCKKENISLSFVSAPMPIETLKQLGNYDDIHDFFENLFYSYNLEYYDFNLVSPKKMKRNPVYFKDNNHLNGYGAQIFSNLYIELMQEPLLSDIMFVKKVSELA